MIITRAGWRLLATVENSEVDPVAVMFSTIMHHLKQHGIRAESPDELNNSLVCIGSMAQVLMGLSSLGWSHGKEEPVQGGLYCSGSSVIIQAVRPICVTQTSVERVNIWLAQDPSTIPQEKLINSDIESSDDNQESLDQESLTET